jgi:hypothetical protein
MKSRCVNIGAAALLMAGAVLSGGALAGADGTERLGTPSIAVASGSGIVVAGTGLFTQPGTITVDVPADATVRQALLYYELGHHTSGPDHDHGTIVVNGRTLNCALIGGPTVFYADVAHQTRRCDITDEGLIVPGSNTLEVSGLHPDDVNDGAGVMVIYGRPGEEGEIILRDGSDAAFAGFAGDLQRTVPQTYSFPPATVDRVARLSIMAASIANYEAPNFAPRPATLLITAGDEVTTIVDPFPIPGDGAQWDSGVFDIDIPAGATSITVQMVSGPAGGALPASLVWLGAGLSVPVPPEPTTTSVLGGQVSSTTTSTTTTTTAPTPETTVAPAGTTTTVLGAAVTTSKPTRLPQTGGPIGDRAGAGLVATALGLSLWAIGRRRGATA